MTPSAAAAAAGIPAAVPIVETSATEAPTGRVFNSSPPRAPSYSPIPSPWDKKRQTFELKKIVREVMGDDDDDDDNYSSNNASNNDSNDNNYASNDDDQGPRFSLDTSMSPLLLEADKMDCN